MNDRIIKLLNLTQSDNDHEALNALRLVNKLMKDDNKTWEIIITKTVTQSESSKLEALRQQYNLLIDKYNQLARDYSKLRVAAAKALLSPPKRKSGWFW